MEDNNSNNKKGFYVALYSTVAIVAMVAIGVSGTGNKGNKAEVEQQQNAELAVNQSPVKSYKETTTQTAKPEDVKEQTTLATKAEMVTETTTVAKKVTKPTQQNTADITHIDDVEYTLFDDSKEMLWPVNGQIVMDYSVETGIFDKTLEQYRTHDSICISANVGESVLAAADGVVLAITNNDEKGNLVAIDHGNGWCTTYSQIDNINLAEGQIVKQGDIIGCIAQPTKYGSGLGSHLDFMVALDKEPTDPKLVLRLEE